MLVRARTALESLTAESFFELVPDERWRDALPADIGAVAALGARVKLRCGERAPSRSRRSSSWRW